MFRVLEVQRHETKPSRPPVIQRVQIQACVKQSEHGGDCGFGALREAPATVSGGVNCLLVSPKRYDLWVLQTTNGHIFARESWRAHRKQRDLRRGLSGCMEEGGSGRRWPLGWRDPAGNGVGGEFVCVNVGLSSSPLCYLQSNSHN